jgi:hypothetical protein
VEQVGVYSHAAFIVGALEFVFDGSGSPGDVAVDLASLKRLAQQLMQYALGAMREDAASTDASALLPEGPATFSELVRELGRLRRLYSTRIARHNRQLSGAAMQRRLNSHFKQHLDAAALLHAVALNDAAALGALQVRLNPNPSFTASHAAAPEQPLQAAPGRRRLDAACWLDAAC